MVKQGLPGSSWIGSDQLGGIVWGSPHASPPARARRPARPAPAYLAEESSLEAEGIWRAGLEGGGGSDGGSQPFPLLLPLRLRRGAGGC